MNYNKIIENNPSTDIIAVFSYGSVVYGTHNEKSDLDYIVVVNDGEKLSLNSLPGVDLTVYQKDEFINLIKSHEISALECLWLPNGLGVDKFGFLSEFELDKTALRDTISQKASNSWVKGKKKFIVEKDFNPYVGKKSVWHSIRILDFGKQIAQHGQIIDYSSVNFLYNEIMSCENWDEINQKYKSTFNNYASEFRLYAPKEQKDYKQNRI